MPKKLIVIGSGFAGISAAAFMAKEGWDVTVLEQQSTPGGRARQLESNGFKWDMGPSWYWMPEIFERWFEQFNTTRSKFYDLKRIDPSYRIYWKDEVTDLPAALPDINKVFDKLEPGSAAKLQQFLKEAEYKYNVGMNKLVFKPGLRWSEFMDPEFFAGIFKLDVFTSISKHIKKFFRHPYLIQLLEFPVLFLGAMPQKIPALYSLMNYADLIGGTWYPDGGMFSIVRAMQQVAIEKGVKFYFDQVVKSIQVIDGVATSVTTSTDNWKADAIISTADYHHTETALLSAQYRSYSDGYWRSRVMAPSCILYYIGLNRKLQNIHHHSLFFDTSFAQHAYEIYDEPQWPSDPMFYLSVPSVTDPSVAPPGCENLFLLIPVAAGLGNDTEELRDRYFNMALNRIESRLNQNIRDGIVFKQSFAVSDFMKQYNAFKGNAYGLANTLMQTANLKPSCRSRKVKNLFYAGQLTVPGPGVPPALISGELVAREVVKHCRKK